MTKHEKTLTVIRNWKLNHTLIAKKIGMPNGTFKNKISPNADKYQFTDGEIAIIAGVLKELKREL